MLSDSEKGHKSGWGGKSKERRFGPTPAPIAAGMFDGSTFLLWRMGGEGEGREVRACVCVAKWGRDLLVCLGLRWLGDLTCRIMEGA